MARSLFLFASAIVALLSLTAANDVPKISHPIVQMLANQELYTTLRTAAANYKHRNSFYGGLKGVCVKLGGKAYYTGKFIGKSSRRKIRVSFKIGMKGALDSMGISGKYESGVVGKFVLRKKGKNVGASVNAKYGVKFYGRAHGKKVSLKGGAKVVGKFGKRGVYVKEYGKFSGFVGYKYVSAYYVGTFDGKVFKFGMRGVYAGKSFYFKYEGSFEGLDFNPMMVERNYGVIYGKAHGKSFRHKYDFKGMPKLA